MQKLIYFLGTSTLIGILLFGITYLFENFQNIVIVSLAVIGLLTVLILLVKLLYGKGWILNLGKEFFLGSDLIKATKNFLNGLPNPSTEIIANFMGHLIYRFTRIGMIGLLLAVIPVWLLFNQNRLIEGQTKILEKQTIRLDQQAYLQEAERRSSLMFSFSNIMDALDTELKIDIGLKEVRDLSPQLIGRIIALSSSLKPYRFLDGDTLINKPFSPERGQLLISLINSKLDTATYLNLIKSMELSEADLRRADLRGANLSQADLSGADLSGADLSKANLWEAVVVGAILRGAILSEADLSSVILVGADLRDAHLRGANLRGANLREADLRGADFKGATLTYSKFSLNNLQDVLESCLIDFSLNYRVDTLKSQFDVDSVYVIMKE